MLRIPNRQNLHPELYCTEFSVQKIPTREKQTDSRILRLSVCYTAFRTSPCTIATIHAIHLR